MTSSGTYILPGLPERKPSESSIKTKGLRILSVVCSHFKTDYGSILTVKSRLTANFNTRKYFYYFLYTELGLTDYFILKHGLSNDTRRNIRYHIEDIQTKLSVKDSETIEIVEEISKYLK